MRNKGAIATEVGAGAGWMCQQGNWHLGGPYECDCLPQSRPDPVTWEADHQQRALIALDIKHGTSLATEFDYGCDTIQHVAEALIVARRQNNEIRTMLLGAYDSDAAKATEIGDPDGLRIRHIGMTSALADSMRTEEEPSEAVAEALIALRAERRFTVEEAERRIMTAFRKDENWRRYRDEWMRELLRRALTEEAS